MNHKKNQIQKYATNRLRTFVCLLTALFIATLFQSVSAQTTEQIITVKGTVFDENKEPVIGASVIVAGTTLGTVSDMDGRFSLKAPSTATITVSYIGYISQKIKVSTAPIVVNLQEESAKLSEVVVVGYGSVKRANLTGAVSNINMKDIADIPSPNLASVLTGTMPGITVSEPTGNPIGSATIKVRTNTTWNAEDPLFVIDGFIRDQEAFNMLDASEIENISVLKDAQASVYGVRGAGGVIIVTTKKGKTGKTKVSYSGSVGLNVGINMPEMMSAYEQGVALNDYWKQSVQYANGNENDITYFTDSELQKMKSLNYNWLDMAWKNSTNNRHTLNVSGGNEDVKYFIGGNYMYANGNFSDLYMNRYGIRIGVDANLAKNLTANFSVNYNSKNTSMPLNQKDAEAERMYGTFSDLVRAPKFIPAYIDGLAVGNSIPSNGTHPLEVLNSGSYRKSRTNDVSAGMSLEYKIEKIKGLKASISANYSNNSGYGKQLSKPYYVYKFYNDGDSHLISDVPYPTSDDNYRRKITNGDKLYESADYSYSYQLNPKISYNNKFGKHDISSMLVYEQSESGGNNLNTYRNTMIIDNYEVMPGYSTEGMGNNSTINTLSRRQSFIGRFNYNYDDKYFIETATRYESSTNFAPEYRWGLFPSVSVGWRISEEDFFKNTFDFVNNLKFRASYGRLGSDKASANQWRSSYAQSAGAYTGGTAQQLMLYPDLEGLVYYNSTWEKTDSYNAGFDLKVFNDFNFGIDGFFKHTFDILDDFKSLFAQSSGVSGTGPKLNYGIANAWGLEFDFSYNKRINKDFEIFAKANIAYATSKIIKKVQNIGNIGTWRDEEGRIRGGEVGYTCIGIARTQEDIDNYIAELKSNSTSGTINVFGMTEDKLKPGMLMFKDMGSAAYMDADGNWHNGLPDGNINEEDQRIISKYDSPPFNYGFSLGFTWKSLRIDALFNGSFGNDVIFEKGFYENASGGSRTGDFLSLSSNQLREWYGNYWTENNIYAKYPRLDENSLRNKRSTFWMRDGHTLRLRSVNVSYSLPKNWSNLVGVEQCRVFFSGTNLLTIINPYPYKDASVGFWSDYPMVQSFNFGLNLNF